MIFQPIYTYLPRRLFPLELAHVAAVPPDAELVVPVGAAAEPDGPAGRHALGRAVGHDLEGGHEAGEEEEEEAGPREGGEGSRHGD